MIIGHIDAIWAGTESSLNNYLESIEQSKARLAAGWSPDEEEESEAPRLLDVQGNIGVVSIRGPLINGDDSWMHAFFGVTSYGAIRDALVSAASNPEIDHILLDIDSGGGAVSGVADMGKLISTVNESVKPVTAFTDGTMASAAYWLGSSAGRVYSTDTSTVGSIGVIATHKEYSKQLAEAGIGVTVMRAGKYKALVNAVEPLSAAAKEQLQGQLDDAYKIFVNHVAQRRGVPYDFADANMAQGREFFGARAVEAGLVDGITSFDTLFAQIQQEIVDTENRSHQNAAKINHMGIGTMKKAFTNTQLAAIAEGVAVEGSVDPVAAEPVAAAGATTEVVAPEAAVAEVPAVEAAAPEAAVNDKNSELVSYLNAQVQEKDKAILESAIKLAALESKVSALEASVPGLIQIAAKSVNNMQIALGGSASDFTAATADAVVTEHARVSEQFKSKFKAGGVAAVDASMPTKKSEPVVDAMAQARLAATRLS